MLSSLPSPLITKISPAYHDNMMEFTEIVAMCFMPDLVKHEVCHHVEARSPPILTPACGLDPQKYAVMKAEFEI